MKTVRFTKVVESAGKPDVHLLLTDPAKDPILKKAIKSDRGMTVHQPAVGTKADFGTVGFIEGVMGQILIFPNSIGKFEGSDVVGIKYDLLKAEPASRRNAIATSKTKGPSRHGPLGSHHAKGKIVPFPGANPPAQSNNGQIDAIKSRVRQALRALEEGKQVVASQLLQSITETGTKA